MWYRILARNNMIVSPSITVTRNRDFSRATSKEVLNLKYRFIDREEEFISDPHIGDRKKSNICALIDRYRLIVARNYLKLGKKKECKIILRTIHNTRYFPLELLVTRVCTYLPKRLLKRILGYDENKEFIVNE